MVDTREFLFLCYCKIRPPERPRRVTQEDGIQNAGTGGRCRRAAGPQRSRPPLVPDYHGLSDGHGHHGTGVGRQPHPGPLVRQQPVYVDRPDRRGAGEPDAGYYLGGFLADRWPRYSLLAHLLAGGALTTAAIPLLQSGLRDSLNALDIIWGPVLATLLLLALPSCLLAAVSPFAVRLISLLSADKQVGFSAGSVSTASTVGSVAGTFLAGFVLIRTGPALDRAGGRRRAGGAGLGGLRLVRGPVGPAEGQHGGSGGAVFECDGPLALAARNRRRAFCSSSLRTITAFACVQDAMPLACPSCRCISTARTKGADRRQRRRQFGLSAVLAVEPDPHARPAAGRFPGRRGVCHARGSAGRLPHGRGRRAGNRPGGDRGGAEVLSRGPVPAAAPGGGRRPAFSRPPPPTATISSSATLTTACNTSRRTW